MSSAQAGAHGGAPPRRMAREAEYAARWRDGAWLGQRLTTMEGERYTLRYQGRPGTGTGPDFRDAVLLTEDGTRICGDVELHLRPRNWQAHGHDRDRRYNNVALHVVIAPGDFRERATIRQDGGLAPITVLPDADATMLQASRWPCRSLGERSLHQSLIGLLRALGEARLHERAAALGAALSQPAFPPSGLEWSSGDVTLWLALAEALGYGRDREAMRDAGWRMVSSSDSKGQSESLLAPPSRTGRTARGLERSEEQSTALRSRHEREAQGDGGLGYPRLDARRMEGLTRWFERWRVGGPWRELEGLLRSGGEREAARNLSRAFAVASDSAISPSRAAIVVVNVALPFALATAERTDDVSLERRVHTIYSAMPGLPSNTISRVLVRQIGLTRLPSGAQAQQGLHHVWAHWCREKRCESCPLASLGGGITIAARAGS